MQADLYKKSSFSLILFQSKNWLIVRNLTFWTKGISTPEPTTYRLATILFYMKSAGLVYCAPLTCECLHWYARWPCAIRAQCTRHSITTVPVRYLISEPWSASTLNKYNLQWRHWRGVQSKCVITSYLFKFVFLFIIRII